MTGPHWQTLTELQAAAGDEVRHLYGSRHRIARQDAYGCFWGSDGHVLMNTRVWRMAERRTDREARMREQEVEGTS